MVCFCCLSQERTRTRSRSITDIGIYVFGGLFGIYELLTSISGCCLPSASGFPQKHAQAFGCNFMSPAEMMDKIPDVMPEIETAENAQNRFSSIPYRRAL